jgi:penicillin-binding protein 1A
VQLEKSYTKNEILEMYLNESYFGKSAYGIASAADVYFNKRVQDLTITEAALFVALLKSHVYYDPVKRYNNAIQRRNLVMYNMVQTGYLSSEAYQKLKEEPIKLSLDRIKNRFKSNLAPHYVEYVRQQLEDLSDQYGFDIYEDGLTIYTSLDTRMQRIANESVTAHLDEFQPFFDKRWNWNRHRDLLNDLLDKAIKQRGEYLQAETKEEKKAVYERLKKNVALVDSVQQVAQTIEVGFVALDITNGQIKAMVGGRNQEFAYGLNHAAQITRQPGSSFKPIVYIVALDNGLYPAYPILNQPFNYEGWEPKNFDKATSGFMTLREGLRHSVNLVSARLIIEGHVELWKVGRYAQQMGIKTKLDLVPSISLGTAEVSPLEITSAYATIVNRGIYNEPIAILKIEDKDGIVIDNFFPETQEAISAETAFLITDMMQDVVNRGSGARVRMYFNRPAAGKTGTTQAYGDAWFVGFTPQLAAGVWVGFDDRRVAFTGNYGQGSRAALPIWALFMKGVYEEIDMPIEDFYKPQNGDIARVNFCKNSILELGNPKIVSDDCKSGVISDYIKLQDIPSPFNAERDTSVRIFERYLAIDSTAHEAFEIVDEGGL